MILRRAVVPALLGLLGSGAVLSVVPTPPAAAGLTVPVQCELGRETVLAWDDLTYDLEGTCGVVRVTADGATVDMPAATHLVVEGAGTTITARPLLDVEVTGPGTTLTTPSIRSLVVSGAGSTVAASGLVEEAELASTASALTADTVGALRLRGSDTVRARRTYRVRVTGSDNLVALTRAERLVLTGDRNGVTVARGRTTVRDRGTDNVLDLRPRRR